MPHFLVGMDFNLEAMLLALAISFVISVILIWGVVAPINKSRLNQLRTRLEKDILNSEQQRMQLGSELNNLQQKIQKTELKVTEQTARITELEKDRQAAKAEAERASALELSLNQKNQEFAQLTGRLQESEKKLENLQQNWQTSVAEKEAAINSLTDTLNQQKAQTAQAEQNLQQLQIEFNELQQAKIEQQQQLEGTILQVERLEQRLADRSAKSPETLEQQQTLQRLQESNQTLERKLQESETVINEVKAKNEKKTAPVEAELIQKIAELNTTLTEQGNYIFRLEYDLEVKKALINDNNSPLKTIPAAILSKQEQAEARIIELEQKLNPKRKDVKKTVEKIQPKQLEIPTPTKQQIDEIADKAKQLPDQFKGFYQKILAKKTQETPAPKSSNASDSKKSEPKKQTQTKEVSVKTSAADGLKRFFKKWDNQAEAIEPEKSSSAKKSLQEKQTQAEESVTKSGWLGIFKR